MAQSILLLDGTAGGGKTTFVRVICGLIGERNVASLRTNLLDERFEVGRLLGHTLLYGADVPSDFLSQRSTGVLKSLTGGNLVRAELKHSNEKPEINCRFNVLVDSNVRLSVHLQGDAEAWRRRLKVVRYTRPKPKLVIADLAERILREEASGVLNFALDGIDQLRADGWQLRLNDRQQRIVDDLLLESDGHREFIRRCLVRDDDGTVLLNDAFAAYVDFCNDCGWAAVTRNQFGKLAPDVVTQEHRMVLRHDIKDGSGKSQRGWRGLKLRATGSGSENASEVSAIVAGAVRSDTSDGYSPLHPTPEPVQAQPLFSL